jgi:hypothetical protein
MTEAFPQELEALTPVLVVEIERYLDAVELFRREGCEPHWRSWGSSNPSPINSDAEPRPSTDGTARRRAL